MMKMIRIMTAVMAVAVGPSCTTQPVAQAQVESAPPAAARSHGDARTLSADFRAATGRVFPAVARIDVVARGRDVSDLIPRVQQIPFPLPFDVPEVPEQGSPLQAGTGSGFVLIRRAW